MKRKFIENVQHCMFMEIKKIKEEIFMIECKNRMKEIDYKNGMKKRV